MAIVKGQILGNITGKIGNVVQRNRYGKTVLYLHPSKYKASQSVQAKEGRSKFALSVAFAKAVNSVEELKQVWKFAKLEGVVPYNRVIKYNRNLTSNNSLTDKNIIAPGGIEPDINSVVLNGNEISIHISAKNKEMKSLLKSDFNIGYVLYLYNPKTKTDEEFILFNGLEFYSSVPDPGNCDMLIKLNKTIITALKRYKNLILYLSALKVTHKKNEVYWTTTYSKEFEL